MTIPFTLSPQEELAALAEELQLIQRAERKLSYRRDPVLWHTDKIGGHLWSKQREILESVRDHSHTAVHSCHEIGKSYIAASVVGWWLDIHPPGEAFVVTSAPTASQVRAILWHEINRVHGIAGLPGRTNQTEWWLFNPVSGKEEQVAIGRKPDEYQSGSFQGLHRRFMLYVLDEACGIPVSLWVAAESMIANDESKALVIGNPDDPKTEFGTVCKPNSGWHVIGISAFDSPNFTNENVPEELKRKLIGFNYVERMRKRWASTWKWSSDRIRLIPPEGADPKRLNPFFTSKVLGAFPENASSDSLIPLQWVHAAQRRDLSVEAAASSSKLGVDVGGGSDSTTIGQLRGPVFRIINENFDPDTMHNVGNVIDALNTTGAKKANVDYIGIGRGIVDRGRELKKPFVPINVGLSALENPDPVVQARMEKEGEAFLNLRAQLWWNVRTLFETGMIDIDSEDEQLAAELVEIRFERMSNGKIKIESKRDMIARGVASPNRADALMLAAAEAAKEENAMEGKVIW